MKIQTIKALSLLIILQFPLLGNLTAQSIASSSKDINSLTSKDFNLIINHWTQKDGYPTWKIYDFFQGSSGLFWLGTAIGLYSFDGYEFKEHDVGLKNDERIIKMMEHNGEIWFETKDKLDRGYQIKSLNLLTDSIRLISSSEMQVLPEREIFDFFKAKDTLWLLNTLNYHNDAFRAGDQLEKVLHEENKFVNTTLYPIENELFWKIDKYENDTKQNVALIDGKGEKIVEYQLDSIPEVAFWQDKNLNLWAAYGEALKSDVFDITDTYKLIGISKNGIQSYRHEQMPKTAWSHSHIFWNANIVANPEGILWVRPYKKGKLLYHHQVVPIDISTQIKTQFEEKNAGSVYIGRDGNFWTFNKKALLKIEIEKNPFTIYLNDEKQAHSTRGITIGTDGYLYANTYANAKKIDLATGKSFPFVFEYNNAGLALLEDQGNIWVGRHHGGNVIEYSLDGTMVLYPYNTGRPDQAVQALFKSQSNHIFVGTNKGLFFIDTLQKQTKFKAFEENSFLHFHENQAGIWAATEMGLYLLNNEGEKLRHYFQAGFQEQDWSIRFIHEDAKGHFWLATENGLVHWSEKEDIFEHFTTKQGLSHNIIHAVYEDKNEILWLPSDYGLMTFNKKNQFITTYFEDDGISHNEFNTFSHFQAADGRLYFGGLNGITAFYPERLSKKEVTALSLGIIDATVTNGQTGVAQNKTNEVKRHKAITLSSDENFFSLKVSAFVLKNEINVEFGWRLKGQQKDWVVQKSNIIQLNNLPYDQHTLEIKARYIGNDWSSETLAIELRRLRPFYMRQSFLLSALIVLGFIIFGLFRWRTRQLEKDKALLELEVQNRTFQIQKDKQLIEQQAADLKKLDEAKTRFFSNITHELRTPLTLIIGPTEQILEKDLPTWQKPKMQIIKKNAQHLLHLINQLLDVSKLESGSMKVETSKGDIVTYTKDLIQQFQPIVQQKQQRLVFVSTLDSWETYFDKEKLHKLIYNLVSNAIKYTPNYGYIQFGLSKSEAQGQSFIEFQVRDTGIGMKKTTLSNVFNRFFQADNSLTRQNEGTGIGLALVKELVDLQQGEITVESQFKKGSIFKVKLPVLSKTVNEPATVETPQIMLPMFEEIQQEVIAPKQPSTSKTEKEKLKLLIIEDNKDLRIYIRQCLGEENYHIYEAENGAIGIEQALEHIPDLIISDIMMPLKDGYEVTQTIRANKLTSHIPLIILSAKSSLDSRLKGLERGADAYLTKPFSPKELNLRIRKLIEIRRLLQQRYQNGTPSPISNASLPFEQEDQFIKDIKGIIQKHLDKTDLNGDFIGRQVGMSRMQLHRKIKALTNQSISPFIREIRLKKAYQLIHASEYNISEVAYQTGFNTPKHFSKTFKQRFGMTPSEALKSVQ